jgi:hypothetical protein
MKGGGGGGGLTFLIGAPHIYTRWFQGAQGIREAREGATVCADAYVPPCLCPALGVAGQSPRTEAIELD